jgi:hypothetical protein
VQSTVPINAQRLVVQKVCTWTSCCSIRCCCCCTTAAAVTLRRERTYCQH